MAKKPCRRSTCPMPPQVPQVVGWVPRRGALAQALDAGLRLVELQHFFGTGNHFLQGDLHVVAQVRSGTRRRAPAPATAPAAKAEQFLENAAEAGEHVLSATEALEAGALQAIVAVAVVQAALLGVVQHVVSFRRLLELSPRPPGRSDCGPGWYFKASLR